MRYMSLADAVKLAASEFYNGDPTPTLALSELARVDVERMCDFFSDLTTAIWDGHITARWLPFSGRISQWPWLPITEKERLAVRLDGVLFLETGGQKAVVDCFTYAPYYDISVRLGVLDFRWWLLKRRVVAWMTSRPMPKVRTLWKRPNKGHVSP